MEVCPGPWAKAEHLLLVFPMPFSLVACEAKIGSLQSRGSQALGPETQQLS